MKDNGTPMQFWRLLVDRYYNNITATRLHTEQKLKTNEMAGWPEQTARGVMGLRGGASFVLDFWFFLSMKKNKEEINKIAR